MRKRKAAAYIGVIASLIAISIVTPLVIETLSREIERRIRKGGMEEETYAETESVDELAALTLEEVSEEEESESIRPGKDASKAASSPENGIIPDEVPYYEEPVFSSKEEEDAANKKAYEQMEEKLLTAEQAASSYRKNFHPEYDELKSGLMNAFISGREDLFYEEIANYCFGHYNTSFQIRMVRFDALLEDTDEKMTVILEFFTEGDLKNDSYIPDLKLCTYNKKTKAFVFFSGAGR